MTVASDLIARWRFGASRITGFSRPAPPAHIGDAVPVSRAEVRIGRLMHAYDVWNGPPVDAFVAGGFIREPGQDLPSGWPEGPTGGFGRQFWQNFWTPADGEDGEWTDLPNTLEWSIQQGFQQNGLMVLTITIENIAYPAVVGPNGAYHQIKRGYYAPNRGFTPTDRIPVMEPAIGGGLVVATKNDWYRKLNSGSCQMRLWAGYGDAEVPVFTGLVDDDELESHPDRIVLTLRDFGQSLTDMRLFGWNKEPRIKDPVTFEDRLRADNVRKVGYSPAASSSSDGHPSSLVIDEDPETFWQSDAHDDPDHTEWVEIELPQGRYENFFLLPHYTGMDVWVSLNVRNRDVGPATADGVDLPEGWVDVGNGDVPGTSTPFIRHREGMPAKGELWGLHATYRVGDGTKLRVHFRSLRRDNGYRAGVGRMYGARRTLDSAVIEKHWILVDDVSDMVRTVLRWAGFKEWDVEQTGVRLKAKIQFPRSNTYMDVIKKCQDLTGFVFFMLPPTTDDDSIGIPVFREPLVTDPQSPVRASLRDTDLLTGIRVKEADSSRAYIVRARGRTATADEGGVPLSGDRTRRLMFTFKPPGWKRLGGIVTHVVHTNHAFKTLEMCRFAAYYIALQGLLEAFKATCSLPAFPSGVDGTRAGNPRYGVELDSHLAVLDVGTGMTTRIWLSDINTEFRQAEQGARFFQNVGGTLVDTPEVQRMVEIINTAKRSGE